MGRKKRKKELKPFCYYCSREFENENTLVDHQKAQHFRCAECHKRMQSIVSLTYHSLHVHHLQITAVPKAKPERDSITVNVIGMQGIPKEAIEERIRKEEEKNVDENGNGETKKVKLLIQSTNPNSSSTNNNNSTSSSPDRSATERAIETLNSLSAGSSIHAHNNQQHFHGSSILSTTTRDEIDAAYIPSSISTTYPPTFNPYSNMNRTTHPTIPPTYPARYDPRLYHYTDSSHSHPLTVAATSPINIISAPSLSSTIISPVHQQSPHLLPPPPFAPNFVPPPKYPPVFNNLPTLPPPPAQFFEHHSSSPLNTTSQSGEQPKTISKLLPPPPPLIPSPTPPLANSEKPDASEEISIS